MKKSHKLIVLLILILGIFEYRYLSTLNDIKDIDDIHQKVLFVYIYCNAACDITYKGYYIDNKGDVYWFDLGEKINTESEEINKVGLPYYFTTLQNKELFAKVNKKELLKYYNELLKVDEKSKVKSKFGGNDMGYETYYGVRSDENGVMQMIELCTTGDSISYNTDWNARKIAIWIKSDPYEPIAE